jgi:uncharacterized secreted protein with C-terminal beta-propeller domain
MKEKMKVLIVLSALMFFSLFNSSSGLTQTFSLNLQKGWNLISLPVYPDDLSQLPESLVLYEYIHGTYVPASGFKPGNGYWVKSPKNVTYNITGSPFTNYSKELAAGWHIIGAVNQKVCPSTVPQDTAVTVFVFRDGLYKKVETLEPGQGYWIKVKKTTALTVQASKNLARLKSPGSPDEFESLFKEKMIAYMTHILNKNLEEALNTDCQSIYGYYDWDMMYPDGITFAEPLGLGIAPPSAPPLPSVPESIDLPSENNSANEFSETNNQVAGVDEADFIKNDGAFIYILTDNKFKIIDVWPPENSSVISQIDIQGTPEKLFIYNNHAVIYSSLENLNVSSNPINEDCTYGYSCEFTGNGKKLKITVLDLSDKYDPQILRELFFNGSYINSRRIDNAVYSIILFPEQSISGIYYEPGLSYCQSELICDYPSHYCNDWWCGGYRCYWYSYRRYTDQEIRVAFESLKQENIHRIMTSDLSSFIPTVRDVRYINGQVIEKESPISEFDEIHFSGQQDGMNFISIFSFDIDDIESRQSVSLIGKPGAVYASSTACYIASRHSRNPYAPWFSFRFWDFADDATTIHKFNLEKHPARSFYVGSGAVKGRVLNQFAMDEHKGFLRIATTSGYTPSPLAHSILTVLEESLTGNLVPVGKIDNIAPSEDIRSVRFRGDKGFIVTFKKIDPLFAIDLSSPYSPVITGELHIPGFSTYIHFMDTNHLLSIGYDGDDQGSFSWFQGIMLQIFDISDMTQPILKHKEVIGTRGTTSEAATNHLAFNYFKPKNILAVPMAICEGDGTGGYYGDVMTFNGLMIFKTSSDIGFEYLGGVSHGGQSSCRNWWTDSNSQVKRSIFMDEYVFSVADNEIRVANISKPGTDVSVIELSD